MKRVNLSQSSRQQKSPSVYNGTQRDGYKTKHMSPYSHYILIQFEQTSL